MRFKAQRQIDVRDLPSPATKLALLGTAIRALTAAGYCYIGMDHFALPNDPLARALDQGTLRRNFRGYSTHGQCDLIGLGYHHCTIASTAPVEMLYELVGETGRLRLLKMCRIAMVMMKAPKNQFAT